jgi:hypothetical protein
MTLMNRIAFVFGFVPSQRVQTAAKVATSPAPETTAAKKPVKQTALAVNDSLRKALATARAFYFERNDRIVYVELDNLSGAFEDILLMSASDGASVETAKLLGQVPSTYDGSCW